MKTPIRLLCRSFLSAALAAGLVALPVASWPPVASAAEVKLDAPQQEAVNKLKAKGASVMQIAADSDALAVNLGMAGKAAGDDELALVKALPKVTELDLRGTGVTDAGLANLAGLSSLTHLHLERTGVTDAGIAHLKGLSNLVYLNLYGTGVGDAGVAQLKELKNLRRLYLWQTKVTDDGAKALKSANPELFVNRGEEMQIVAAATPAAPAAAAPAGGATELKVGPGNPVNAKCPVSNKAVDKEFTVSFEGKTVGFCCGNCPGSFSKDPKKFVAKIPELKTTAAAAPAPTPPPASAAKTTKVEPADLKLDEEGFVRAWLLLAPIPLGGDSAADAVDKEQVAGEAALKPKAGDKAKAGDAELTWREIKAEDYYFDINQALGTSEDNAAAYAVVYLDSATEQKDVVALMSTNDEGKLYLNGKELAKHTEGRSIDKDQDKVENVTLVKGQNVVVLKVINESNNWQGALRFTTKDGKPVTDLKVALAPAGAAGAGKGKGKAKPAAKPAPKAEATPAAGKVLAAPAPLAAAAATAAPAAPAVAPVANLLKPTGDAANWRLEQHEGAKATIAAADGGIVFDVTEPSGTDWHVQAFQSGLDLTDGKEYTVKFKAKADADDRAVRAQAGIDVEDWHTIGFDEEVTLGKEWKDYSYTFTASDTSAKKNRLGFVLGGAKGKVYVKDLVLTAK